MGGVRGEADKEKGRGEVVGAEVLIRNRQGGRIGVGVGVKNGGRGIEMTIGRGPNDRELRLEISIDFYRLRGVREGMERRVKIRRETGNGRIGIGKEAIVGNEEAAEIDGIKSDDGVKAETERRESIVPEDREREARRSRDQDHHHQMNEDTSRINGINHVLRRLPTLDLPENAGGRIHQRYPVYQPFKTTKTHLQNISPRNLQIDHQKSVHLFHPSPRMGRNHVGVAFQARQRWTPALTLPMTQQWTSLRPTRRMRMTGKQR